MESKIKHLKLQILSGKTLTNYVDCLSDSDKRDFLNDTIDIIFKFKKSYRRTLIVHLMSTLILVGSYFNLNMNYSGISAIFFISSFSVFFIASRELYKQWKTVRNFKLLKKMIQQSFFGYSIKDEDDFEFLPFR